jgi:hypothetical protein
MFARPQYPGVLAAAASWNDSRTGRLGQAPAASLPGGRLRMRLVIALSGPPQRAAAGQERLTEAVKRRADEVLKALRGENAARKVCNWLQSRKMNAHLDILCRPCRLDRWRITLHSAFSILPSSFPLGWLVGNQNAGGAAATNYFTTAGAARQPGQPAGPNPHASLCQHRSAARSPP